MSEKIDAPTTRRCRACHEIKPLYCFPARPELKKSNRTCSECRNHTPGPTASDLRDDPYLDAPRPSARLRESLPPLGTRDRCPRCDREWAMNTRCMGYHMSDCGEYVPHFHRRCLTCAQEILEADPDRAEFTVVSPLPMIGVSMLHDLTRDRPAMSIHPDGTAPDFQRHPFWKRSDHHMNPTFAAIARQLMGAK